MEGQSERASLEKPKKDKDQDMKVSQVLQHYGRARQGGQFEGGEGAGDRWGACVDFLDVGRRRNTDFAILMK
jgi:hypothetical protein